MGGLVGKRGQSLYLRFAVLWFLLLLGSSWLGWGGGSGCFKKIQMLGIIANTQKVLLALSPQTCLNLLTFLHLYVPPTNIHLHFSPER